MQNDVPSVEYLLAEGPQGLEKVLESLLEQPNKPPNEYYILYYFGAQKSLIKVDIGQQPFLFWYYDLLGRPATNVVKDILAKFAWEKGGEKERYLQDLKKQNIEVDELEG